MKSFVKEKNSLKINYAYSREDSLIMGFFSLIRSLAFLPGSRVRRQHTLKRLLNFLLLKLQFFFCTDRVFGYPSHLVLEPTNICNLKCPLCPTGQAVSGRPKGKMSFTDFQRIIDEMGDYLYSLRLENWGEPLLNKDISDMVAYATSKRISTSFNTNLCLLDKETAEKLILSGLKHIKISLDGSKEDSYLKYRVGGDFNKVVDNIKLLVDTRNTLNKPNPFIEVQFIVMKHNQDEIVQIKQLCKELNVDALHIAKLHPDMREELFYPDSHSIVKFADWLPADSMYSLFDYKTKTRKHNIKRCNYLWTSCVVNYDGGVVPCCSIFDQKYDFGNLFQSAFQHIWNGPKYVAARRLIGRGAKSREFVVCVNCAKFGIKY